jgi:hypothetical protein
MWSQQLGEGREIARRSKKRKPKAKGTQDNQYSPTPIGIEKYGNCAARREYPLKIHP